MSHINISAKTRALIVKTGGLLQGSIKHEERLSLDHDSKVKYVDIQRNIGGDHFENHDNLLDVKCIKSWHYSFSVLFYIQCIHHNSSRFISNNFAS